MDEALTWLGRALKLLPALIELWNVVKAPQRDVQAELDASLRLVRRMKDIQAREEIEGP